MLTVTVRLVAWLTGREGNFPLPGPIAIDTTALTADLRDAMQVNWLPDVKRWAGMGVAWGADLHGFVAPTATVLDLATLRRSGQRASSTETIESEHGASAYFGRAFADSYRPEPHVMVRCYDKSAQLRDGGHFGLAADAAGVLRYETEIHGLAALRACWDDLGDDEAPTVAAILDPQVRAYVLGREARRLGLDRTTTTTTPEHQAARLARLVAWADGRAQRPTTATKATASALIDTYVRSCVPGSSAAAIAAATGRELTTVQRHLDTLTAAGWSADQTATGTRDATVTAMAAALDRNVPGWRDAERPTIDPTMRVRSPWPRRRRKRRSSSQRTHDDKPVE